MSSWNFLSCYFRLTYFNYFLRASIAISTLLVRARKEFWIIKSHRGRSSAFFFYNSWATQSYQRNIVYIALFTILAQIVLVGPGIRPQDDQRDDFTREPPCLLRSMFGGSKVSVIIYLDPLNPYQNSNYF